MLDQDYSLFSSFFWPIDCQTTSVWIMKAQIPLKKTTEVAENLQKKPKNVTSVMKYLLTKPWRLEHARIIFTIYVSNVLYKKKDVK